MSEFQKKLDEVAADSKYAEGVNAATIEYSFKVFDRFLRDGTVLELGPAEGIMTAHLVGRGLDITCVDGAAQFCAALRYRYPDIEVVNSLFEDYQPDKSFDNIVLGHVLEHVEDPVAVLELVKQWLKPDGLVLTAVPNAMSLHRQAAVIMGLIESEKSMSELDYHHGHHRVFDPFEFRNCFSQAGLTIKVSGGYWMKPVSNIQIEKDWSAEMLEAFMVLGERYPDIAGEIYVIASH